MRVTEKVSMISSRISSGSTSSSPLVPCAIARPRDSIARVDDTARYRGALEIELEENINACEGERTSTHTVNQRIKEATMALRRLRESAPSDTWDDTRRAGVQPLDTQGRPRHKWPLELSRGISTRKEPGCQVLHLHAFSLQGCLRRERERELDLK